MKQVKKSEIEALLKTDASIKEIAAKLGIPVSTLKEGIKQFKINLRKRPRAKVAFINDESEIPTTDSTTELREPVVTPFEVDVPAVSPSPESAEPEFEL